MPQALKEEVQLACHPLPTQEPLEVTPLLWAELGDTQDLLFHTNPEPDPLSDLALISDLPGNPTRL